MSTVTTRRPTRRARDRDWEAGRSAARQERLFGGAAAPSASATTSAPARTREAEREREPAGVASAAPLAPELEPAADAPHAVSGPTLDDAISALWGELARGSTIGCPACGSTAMAPRHSAGAGVVGGRCGACEATLA
jgi:hypothetical protein